MAGLAQDGRSLARELEDVREQQRAVSGVLRAVARSAGLQPVLDEVVEAARRLCGADYGALYLLDDTVLRVATFAAPRQRWITTASILMRSTGRRVPAVR